VKILSFLRNKKQFTDLENFRKTGIQIETVKLSVLQSLFRIIIALFSQIPFQVAWFSSDKMKRKIREYLKALATILMNTLFRKEANGNI